MPKPLNATDLRANLYRVLDEVLETGRPQEVVRGQRTLLIVPAGQKRRRLEDLPRRKGYIGSADDLVSVSWEGEWKPEP